ncbi:3-hydroxyacyl-CoA dehydrogenase NAD-binding domain-containing protein [Massilia sp. TS11]|uniref:3-hydroxyacyl-CoA dehydrogenase NAD-binding domain-containing protein n=1 Tax=Massilia sp. TS11 TaxID=2908003 RepID=UPI001EDACC39|nr:3-hydroxyacyl-CoA dehydrogenase NAD-binding domain-containing protein [Massilia sp. TS11]MCG2583790.1 3-hydroxyacyl-CoA dehydrogenase NAD-binding domain-containing protein [Massilia sp. TS11]
MITATIDADGIATLAWDAPGHSQNLLDQHSCAALYGALDASLADPAVKGILLTSDKTDFIAGADLRWLAEARDAAALFEQTMRWQRALRTLETSGKPVAVAMPGSALGGGLELALACHYRVAAEQPRARFGLPEVTLGLLPGGGGTQRLARLIGVARALPLLLEGKRLDAHSAREAGILDAVVPAGTERAEARAWLLEAIAAGGASQPWDRKGYKMPGGAMASPAVQQLFVGANAMLRARTYGNYPAPQAILSCLYEGLGCDIDTGLQVEARHFVHTVLTPAAKQMVRTLFFSMNAARRLAARPQHVAPRTVSRIGVLGAGMMGAGIAYVAAKAGLHVVLLDTSEERANAGKDYARKQAARLTPEQGTALLERITASADYGVLTGCELVIEAVFEERALKASVTRQAEALLGEDAVFASNTSTLPISGLAEASARPANFIGLHFFSPVERMPLVEVIVGAQTSEATLAHALDFVRQLGMTPIVVRDGRGFYTSRVFSTYVLEGMAMLAEGVHPALIENAGQMAGMPVGPLALTDEVSSELIDRIDRQSAQDLGAAYQRTPGHAVATQMVALGRPGRKAGQGFYDYPAEGGKRLWSGLGEHYPPAATQPTAAQLIERFITIQSLEAARCMEEGVLRSAADADVGAVLGWGYPAFRGGPLAWIDQQGAAAFAATCTRLAAQHGARYAPNPALQRLAEQHGHYYGD